jgi:hypothetical protein
MITGSVILDCALPFPSRLIVCSLIYGIYSMALLFQNDNQSVGFLSSMLDDSDSRIGQIHL